MRYWLAARDWRAGWAALWVFTAAACALSACETSPGPKLATIDEVSPGVLEPGDVLRISGSGFVEGPVRITLRGMFDPVGLAPPKERRVHLEANTASSTWIELPISESIMNDLTSDPVVFSGQVEVSFPKSLSIGSVRIGATSPKLTIEIRPAGCGVETAAKRQRAAERFLARLGLHLSGDRGDELLVLAVDSNSPSDRAGVEPGDRLLGLDRTALVTTTDLAGVEHRDSYELEVISRQGNIRSLSVSSTAGIRLHPDELVAMLLASLALGLFVAFAAPRRGRRGGVVAPGWDPLTRAFALAGVAVVLVAAPAIMVISRSDLGAAAALLAIYVGGVSAAALFGEGGPGARVAKALAHLLPVPLFMILPAASGSLAGLWSAVADQQGSPLAWNAWSSPFALAMAIAATALIWPARSNPKAGQRLATVAQWTAAISGAMALTAYGLGGWNVPGVPPSQLIAGPLPLLAGIMIFALKAWVVLHAARWFAKAGAIERRAQRPQTATRLIVAASALLLATATTLLWEWTNLPADLRSAGQLSAAGLFVTLVSAFALRKLRGLIPQRQG